MTPDFLRETEAEIAALWNAGELNSLVHLMGGNEEWLCDFFHNNVKPEDWVFASHRCHWHYLLHGGTDLVEKVKRGKSMFLYGPRFICSAIVAGTCAIAAGAALGIKRRGGSERVWCFVGDGAADQGHFHEAIRHAHALNLPVTFIVENNDSSCGVSQMQRGAPREWAWPENVIEYRYLLTWPHAGSGEKMTLKSLTPP